MRDSMMPFNGYGFLLPKAGGLRVRAKSKVAIFDALTLRLAILPREISAAPIYKQMEKFGIEKRNLEERVLKLKDKELEKEVPADAITYEKFLDVLRDLKASGITTAKKQKIITSLVERIEIFPDRLEIHYGLGISRVKQELATASSLLNKSLVESSTSLTNGGSSPP